MSFCPNCGTKNEDNALFCTSCGAQLKPADNAAVSSDSAQNAAVRQPAMSAAVQGEPAQQPIASQPVQAESAQQPIASQPVQAESAQQPIPSKPVQNEPTVQSALPDFTQDEPAKPKKKAKFIIIAAVAVVLVAAIVLGVIFVGLPLLSKGSDNETTERSSFLYIKDNDLYFADLSKKEPILISENICDDDGFVADDDFFKLSSDGKKAFYATAINKEEETFDFCVSDTTKKDAEPERIDAEVNRFSISADGSTAVYLKNSNLYIYNSENKEKEKLENEVNSFTLSNDGAVIRYTVDGVTYIKHKDSDKEKLGELKDSEFSEDMSTVTYIDNKNALYQAKTSDIKGTKKKISSDVYSIEQIYDDGSMYYRKEGEKASYYSIVEDDLAKMDAPIQRPTEPVEPNYEDYSTYSAYDAAYSSYELKHSMYVELLDSYYSKKYRDAIRNELKESNLSLYSLCYYDGKEETKALDNVFNYERIADESSFAVYNVFDSSKVKKTKFTDLLSEIYLPLNSYEIEGYDEETIDGIFKRESESVCIDLRRELNQNTESAENIAIVSGKDKVDTNAIEKGASRFFFDKGCKNLYYFVENKSSDSKTSDDDNAETEDENRNDNAVVGTLYKCAVSGNKLQSSELVVKDAIASSSLEDVNNNLCEYGFDKENNPYYITGASNDSGDLYFGGEKVDFDVFSVLRLDNDDTLIYCTDYSAKSASFSVKTYENGESKTVGEDVGLILPERFKDGKYVMLCNFDDEEKTGDLSVYSNGETQVIDDGVSYIVENN